MKGVITIFALPQELEDLALTLHMLKRNSAYPYEGVNYKVEVTMCLSDSLTDWKNSKLPKEYIRDRTAELCEKFLGDWTTYHLQFMDDDDDEILGCVSQRRFSLNNNPDADFFIWLDCDFIFKDTTLYYMTAAYVMELASGASKFVITPQFVKQWDNTWDVLVNEDYWNKPLRYQETANVYTDTLPQLKDVSVKLINTFKFGGGWFTLLSGSLLRTTGVPNGLGHYGLEDTYITECCKIMRNNGEEVYQFILENLIIGESYINRPNHTIKSYIASKSRKDEFTKIAHENFPKVLKQFYERSNGRINGL